MGFSTREIIGFVLIALGMCSMMPVLNWVRSWGESNAPNREERAAALLRSHGYSVKCFKAASSYERARIVAEISRKYK